ncbi:MAG: glutamyl-tRNA reductase, partial [Chloroflexi bacterium]|nr:glutamyl-tRNA reductase [Chloroflexota bacterium]
MVAGLNHRTAPMDVRERLSMTKDQLPGALKALKEALGCGVIISTCNRSEVYTVSWDPRRGRSALEGFISSYFGMPPQELARYMYFKRHSEAVLHLFRVASSLDSMILGESEILGQVRDAFAAASKAGTAEGPINGLFHQALRVGKRARRETAIGRNALSVSRACVELARRVLGDLHDRRVVVVGVG